MAIKYPKYVTTDLDIWNSGDEAYFYVIKKEAKPLTTTITPIIEDALESGLLREATEDEIEEYLLKEDIEKRLQERRFDSGNTFDITKENYFKWKESYEKNNKKKETKPIKEEISEDKIEEVLDKKEKVKPVDEKKDKVTFDKKEEKPLSPTENALKQKATIRSDNMN